MQASSPESGVNYLHGYLEEERSRLLEQGGILESLVLEGVDFSGCERILEPGCGVGAQSRILLERFPDARLLGIDVSAEQIEAARRNHAASPRARFEVGDVRAPELAKIHGGAAFDGAFLCWFLEHLSSPLQALRNIRACLAPGGRIFVREVFNTLLHLHPRSLAVEEYWRAYNRFQEELGGDPYVGAKLPSLLAQAGFQGIEVEMVSRFLGPENRPERDRFLDYWHRLLMSPSSRLLEEGRVTAELLDEVGAGFEAVRRSDEGILFFGFTRGKAMVSER